MGAPAGNFRVVVLRKGSVIVSALTLRVCGLGFAEMPFVATREGTVTASTQTQLPGRASVEGPREQQYRLPPAASSV